MNSITTVAGIVGFSLIFSSIVVLFRQIQWDAFDWFAFSLYIISGILMMRWAFSAWRTDRQKNSIDDLE